MGEIRLDDMSNEYFDVLRELGNIGAGNATTALAQMIQCKVDMAVPKVQLLEFRELGEAMVGEETVMAGIYLGIEGDIKGSIMFLLEKAAAKRPGLGAGAPASLSGHTALLERVVDGTAEGEALFRGKGCSIILRPGRELELSPMEGNVLVKCLPQGDLLPALRRQKGRLQTAGLICAPGKREQLTALLREMLEVEA